MENITITIGNRCGHDRVTPRFFCAPKQHKNRPDILREAGYATERFYIEHKKYLPNLRYANGSYQQQRSERREAAAAVLQVLLHYTDIASLQVGTPKSSGEINGLRIKFIANKLGFGDKRVWRAIHDLKTANYLTIRSRLIKVSEKIFSVSKIQLHPKTFYDLGISQLKLQLSRHYKQKSLMKQGREQATSIVKRGAKEASRVVGGIQTLITGKQQYRPKHQNKPSVQRKRKNSINDVKQASHLLHRLHQQGWTIDKLMAHINAPESTTAVQLCKMLQGHPLPYIVPYSANMGFSGAVPLGQSPNLSISLTNHCLLWCEKGNYPQTDLACENYVSYSQVNKCQSITSFYFTKREIKKQ